MSLPPHRLKVHGFHCDLYGHVNNARYLEFLEAARWETLGRSLDVEEWHRRGWLFVVVNIDIAYRAAATLGDELEIRTRGGEIGRSSAKVHQRVVRPRDGRTVVEATITYVILDRERQRPLALEGEILEGLRRLSADAGTGDDPQED